MTVFELPDVGEGLQEAEIVAWHVAVGDHVVADQPLVSVETDKAVVEIPSPQSGHIAALHGAHGDIVPVGAPLVEFADGEHRDVGAIVGELPRDEVEVSASDASPAAPDTPSAVPPVRPRSCVVSPRSSASIWRPCRRLGPAAASHGPTSKRRPVVGRLPTSPMTASNRCAVCAVRWTPT